MDFQSMSDDELRAIAYSSPELSVQEATAELFRRILDRLSKLEPHSRNTL